MPNFINKYLKQLMYRFYSKILIFLMVYCLVAACGHKGPPLPPKEGPLTQTGVKDFPAL